MGSDVHSPSAATEMPSLVREVLGVQLFSDDTVVRSEFSPWPELPADPNFESGDVGSKDVVIDKNTDLSARIFLPKSALGTEKKLPVIIYFHGGGFVTFRPSSSAFHHLCCNMASKLGIVIVSVDYRLAPEHRLPAAFEDAFKALLWIKQEAQKSSAECENDSEPWLRYADFSRCFLMGDSAGATIVHRMTLKLNECELTPVQIKGLVLVSPYFGGVKRTESEMMSKPDALTLEISDNFWFLALPKGSDRDHAFSKCPEAQELATLKLPPCLMVIGGKDVLHTRQMEYFHALKDANKDVQLLEFKDRGHLVLIPDSGEGSFADISRFIIRCNGNKQPSQVLCDSTLTPAAI